MHRSPALSNAERQRRFRESHPGYEARRKATARAISKKEGALKLAEILAKLAAADSTPAAGPADHDVQA